MSCGVARYLKQVEEAIKEVAPDATQVGRQVLRNVRKQKNANEKVAEYIQEKLGSGHNKVYNQATGNQGFPGFITDVRLTENGNLDVKVRNILTKKEYTYNEVDIQSGQAEGGQRLAMVKGLENRLFNGSDFQPSGYTDMTKPISAASVAANRYASHMLIGYASGSASIIGPQVRKWHVKTRRKSALYKETTNLISRGFSNIELFDKIRASLFLTGDLTKQTRLDVAKLTTLVNESARRNVELLQTELPELDNKIQKEFSKKEQELLDDVFAKSGFGAIFAIPGLINRVENGKESLQEIIDDVSGKDKNLLAAAKKLESYYVDKQYDGFHNAGNTKSPTKVAALAVLMALQRDNEAGFKLVQTMAKDVAQGKSETYLKLKDLAAANYELTEVVNRNKQGSSYGAGANTMYTDYDGNNVMDVYDRLHEFKLVSKADLDKMDYEDTPWNVLRVPKGNDYGILYRESGSSYMEGLGTNSNRINNGIQLDRAKVKELEDSLGTELWRNSEYLKKNNIVYSEDSGVPKYRVVLNKDEFVKAKGKRNVAHSLFRSFTHNKGLIETNTARQMITDKMTLDGSSGSLTALNDRIRANRKVKYDDRKEVKIFLKSGLTEEQMKERYPEVAKKYKKVKNITNYGNFDEEVQYVRRDMSDVVTGHSQKLLLSDEYPNAQVWEQKYKELVQLLKLKLVVANPAKLGVDILSNAGILMSMDVGAPDMYKYGKEAIQLSSNMSKLEGELVKAKFDLALAEADGKPANKEKTRVDAIQNKIEMDTYYDALKYGFVQSMGTSMIMKEFDTISGLQNTMDDMIGKLMVDGRGRKTEIHKAVAWWMDAGFGINDVLDYAGNLSKIKGTSFSEELIEAGERLGRDRANIKKKEEKLGRKLTDKEREKAVDEAGTVRYIGQFLASPASEVVRQGSRVMQMGDVVARWTLYNVRLEQAKELYKKNNGKNAVGPELQALKDEAGIEALDTFVDYRLNMPSEVKLLSDYGVLMFPSFWMRAQRIIFNLAKYHPLNAGGGYIAADLLDMNGASILDANVLSKLIEGHLVHPGQDVLDTKTFILGL